MAPVFHIAWPWVSQMDLQASPAQSASVNAQKVGQVLCMQTLNASGSQAFTAFLIVCGGGLSNWYMMSSFSAKKVLQPSGGEKNRILRLKSDPASCMSLYHFVQVCSRDATCSTHA